MNTYDLTVVFDGKFTPAKKKAAIEKLEQLVTTFNGKASDVIDWGERELAYPIKKATSGLFATFPLEMEGVDAKRLNDKLRLEEGILRYLLIKSEALREKPKKATKKEKDTKEVEETKE